MSALGVADFKAPDKPCHNCRRRRLRCDRSLPTCNKCSQSGQECLGYQKLLLWNKGIASRGKMMGRTFEDLAQMQSLETLSQGPKPVLCKREVSLTPSLTPPRSFELINTPSEVTNTPSDSSGNSDVDEEILRPGASLAKSDEFSLQCSLTDPLFQDMHQNSKFYLSYFSSHVCKDLVIYDLPKQNPFRDLIPLTKKYAVLHQVIIAMSALHLSNMFQKDAFMKRVQSLPHDAEPGEASFSLSKLSQGRPSNIYRDALVAKQHSLRLLSYAVGQMKAVDADIILASVSLFVECELIDSGKSDWRFHINGARKLIESMGLLVDKPDTSQAISLRRCLVSNCLIYEILGSLLTSSKASDVLARNLTDFFSMLKYAETNNYLSCPADLLQIVLAASLLLHEGSSNLLTDTNMESRANQAYLLLQKAESFDSIAWAEALQEISPQCDLANRIHVASAHKSAVCIYVSRVLLTNPSKFETTQNFEHLVTDIVYHLSFIPLESGIIKSTCWPTFIAGAETKDPEQQMWAMMRFSAIWEVLPWGCLLSTMEALEDIWRWRSTAFSDATERGDWIHELRKMEVDLLVA